MGCCYQEQIKRNDFPFVIQNPTLLEHYDVVCKKMPYPSCVTNSQHNFTKLYEN